MIKHSVTIAYLRAGVTPDVEAVACAEFDGGEGVHIKFGNWFTLVCDDWDTAFDFGTAIINAVSDIKDRKNA